MIVFSFAKNFYINSEANNSKYQSLSKRILTSILFYFVETVERLWFALILATWDGLQHDSLWVIPPHLDRLQQTFVIRYVSPGLGLFLMIYSIEDMTESNWKERV